MNKWYMKLFMESGNILDGVYFGEETASNQVIEKLASGNANTINSINSIQDNTQLWFKVGSIEAILISSDKIE